MRVERWLIILTAVFCYLLPMQLGSVRLGGLLNWATTQNVVP